MAEIKHVGRFKTTAEKVVVAYRTLPSDPEFCLVVPTANLEPMDHDRLIELVESNMGQTAYEFAEAMARTRLQDGRVMLQKFHTQNLMKKVKSSEIEMMPNTTTAISLDALNAAIATKRGVKISEIGVQEDTKITTAETTVVDPVLESLKNETVMTDDQLAAKLRSDADRLYKEAARLRKQADELKAKSKESTE